MAQSPSTRGLPDSVRRAGQWLRSLIARNFLLKILSLGIAILLWGMVREDQDVDEIAQVYLKISRPEGLLFLDEVPPFISVRLVGPRSRLRQAQQVRLEMTIDMNDASAGENTINIANFQIRNLPPGVSTAAYHPSVLKLRVDFKALRELTIKPAIIGEPATDHELASVAVEPETVVVEGARSHLEGVERIMTTPIDITGLTRDQRLHVGLDYGDMYVWPQTKLDGVDVDLVFNQLTEKKTLEGIDLQLAPTLGPVKVDPSVVKVIVEGPRSQVAALKASGVQVSVESAQPLDPATLPRQASWSPEADQTGAFLSARIIDGAARGVEVRAVRPTTVSLSAAPAPDEGPGKEP